MARRKRPRRPSVPGLVTFEEPTPMAWASSRDERLLRLAARMRVAEQALHAAMDELAQAEQRLPGPARTGPAGRPAWFAAVARKEEAAGEAVEQSYREIASIRAHTKAGLAIKLGLAMQLYGETVDESGEESDMVSVLLRSLMADVSES